jgi:AcrR family transcriptional regulator
MAPRSYSLGKRAATSADTRQRILDATVELYREGSVATTTLKAVAERADVSRGTIIHHFGSNDGLFGAVLDMVAAQIDYPDARFLEGVEGRDARLRVYVESLTDFFVRTRHWWPIFESEQGGAEYKQREAQYWEALGKFQAAALGSELAADPEANAILMSFVHPATVGTFIWAYEQAGLDAVLVRTMLGDLAVEAIRRLVDRRATTTPVPGEKRRRNG